MTSIYKPTKNCEMMKMEISCIGMQALTKEYVEPCEPCLMNNEMRRILEETQADALKEIPEEYAQEQFGISRDEMDYTHFEQMCGLTTNEYYFPAYVILQTIEIYAVLDTPSFYEDCDTPHDMENWIQEE